MPIPLNCDVVRTPVARDGADAPDPTYDVVMFLTGPRTFDAAKAAYNRRDFRKARRIWTELARAGDPRAQCKLADMYHNGIGASQNIATAIAWYRKAAAQGNSEAEAWLRMRDEQSLRRLPSRPKGAVHSIRPPQAVTDSPPRDTQPRSTPPTLAARPRPTQPAPAATAAKIHRIDDARRTRRQPIAAERTLQPAPLTARSAPAEDEPLVLTEMIGPPAPPVTPTEAPSGMISAGVSTSSMGQAATDPGRSAAVATIVNIDDPVERSVPETAPETEPLPASASVPTRNERLRNAKNAYDAKDFDTALNEWSELAQVGVAEAQLQLAMMYDNGFGVDADQAIAIKWYHQAADQNESRAQYNLAVTHALGNGVPVDFVSAYLWFSLAHASGHAEAGAGVVELERHLSPAQLAIARGRIKQWQARTAGDDG